MTPEALYDLFRSTVGDTALPYLWTEDEVYVYMTQAQTEFVRVMGGIADATTPEIVEIQAVEGEAFAPYSEKILKFRRAQRTSDFRKIDIVNVEDLDSYAVDDYGVNSSRYSLDGRVGPITVMVIGLEEAQVRWGGIPREDEIVSVIVDRLPLYDLTATCGHKFEVREEYHMDLLNGMKAHAFLKQDAETFDRAKAIEFKGLFDAAALVARDAQARRRHKPRLMAYGGL
jgi:hypothetical protein